MRWRSVSQDLAALAELFGRVETAELGRPGTKPEDIRSLLAAPGLDLESRTRVLEADDGRLHGFVALHPAPQPGQLRAHIIVDPEAAHDTAQALFRLLDEWIADDAPDGAPVTTFQFPRCLLHDQLSARGWAIVHSYTRLTVDLDAVEPAEPNSGIRLRAAAGTADQRRIHAVLEDAIEGHWNHQRRSFEEFDQDQRRREGYDPGLWWLAEVDGVPAGAVIARDPAGRAWIAWLGVLDRHRGRGIAKLLLRTAFAQLRERGHATVGVDVDTHNATAAVQVYQAAGMSVLGSADQWQRRTGGPAGSGPQ